MTVDVVEALGYEKLVYFRAEAPRGRDAAGMLDGGTESAAGARVEFCARIGPSRAVREGRAQLFVEPRRLQVFDPDTGAALEAAPAQLRPLAGPADRSVAAGAVT